MTGTEMQTDKEEEKSKETQMTYSINDVPPWYLCILLGIQHYLTMFGSSVAVPYVLAPALCIDQDDPARGYITSTVFFVSGIITFIQVTFGIRLPIVQGVTFSFLIPTFSILNSEAMRLKVSDSFLEANNLTIETAFVEKSNCPTKELLKAGNWSSEEIWQPRMREVQGAIIVASLFEVVIGATGLVGILLSKVSPLTIVPTICLVGLSLFPAAANAAGEEWGIAVLTGFLIILFSEVIKDVKVPLPKISNKKCKVAYVSIFKLFPVLLAILTAWFICFILTVSNALPTTSSARTDVSNSISKTVWFRFPYPGQWGLPTVSVASVFGMLAGVLASMIESIGDYYACARLSNAPPPPTHAINRGITIEGIGCILAGIWGTGNGTTSYSENIGAIGITKIASRRVVQATSLIIIVLGLFSKFGAVFTTIPTPVVGGMFCIMFSIVTAVGLSNLQYINLNSSRNLMILGLSIFMGLALPNWFKSHPGIIQTGVFEIDQIITILLETSVFIGGVIGFTLDNILPGSDEDRGIKKWNAHTSGNASDSSQSTYQGTERNIYGLPLIDDKLRKINFLKYIPICPSYSNNITTCCTLPSFCNIFKKDKNHQKAGQDNQAIDESSAL